MPRRNGVFLRPIAALVSYRPGSDNVENPTTMFYSELVKRRRDFTPSPVEVVGLAWVPFESCVSIVLKREIVDCRTVSGILAYRC